MARLDIEDADDPETFAQRLIESGMAEEKARVYAYRTLGNTVTETAALLDKDKGAVSRYYDSALEDIQNSRKLVHYAYHPEYLKELPFGAGKRLDEEIEHTVSFRLHRPRNTDDGLSIEDCDVLEAFYIEDDTYLLAYYEHETDRTGKPTYFAIKDTFLVRFIHDWVKLGRKPRPASGHDAPLADNFYLTDVFEPQWLEDELGEVGIERVEVLTDERFTDPLEEHVGVHDSALTGTYHDGYMVAYAPTDREVAQRLINGMIDEDTAERLTRKDADDLRTIV